MYLLGYDIGSSSVKAALVNISAGTSFTVTCPANQVMPISAPDHGWAEQDPEMWWRHVCEATQELLGRTGADPKEIKGIGIGYQMHGLVCVDKNRQVLRPSIIWCDSRAVDIGDQAFRALGEKRCLQSLLNSPGNFTASKLKWVMENEPTVYAQINKIMLPGDYIAMKLSGDIQTTASGLSEGIFWDYGVGRPAQFLLDEFGIDPSLLADIVPSVGLQSRVSAEGARETGLIEGTPIGYRAGDQPNNAMALDVLEPGEIAATGGTSGVIYGVLDRPAYDPESRVNGFLHVNHSELSPRIGILLCINGAGIMYQWIRQNIAGLEMSYEQMEREASGISVGSDGLINLPFGNGAERMLGNRDPGARLINLQLNRHSRAHLYRASLEGVACAFAYGAGILTEMGLNLKSMKVGNDNLFRSGIFSQTLSNILKIEIQLVETTGAIGAAKASGVSTGVYGSLSEAMHGNKTVHIYTPQSSASEYTGLYSAWEKELLNLTDTK